MKGKCVCEDGKMPRCPFALETLQCPNGNAPDLSITQLPDPFSKCTENWFEKKISLNKNKIEKLVKFHNKGIVEIDIDIMRKFCATEFVTFSEITQIYSLRYPQKCPEISLNINPNKYL